MHKKSLKPLLIAIFGNFLEYYDYALYGFMVPLLAKIFFPESAPGVAYLKAFIVFAFASLTKPIGAYFFGKMGDKYGRRVSLKWNMLGIALSTFAMALLPTYATVGILATFLLSLCRLAQGIFLGGEVDGIKIYVLEHLGKNRPCLANSLTSLSSSFGVTAAASIAGMVIASNGNPDLWRVPFIFGGLMGILIYFLRRDMIETTPFLTAKKQSNAGTSDYFLTVRQYKKYVFSAFLLASALGGIYHFFFVWNVSYMSKLAHLMSYEIIHGDVQKALYLYTFCLPIAGWIGDKFGARFIFKIGGGVLALVILGLLGHALEMWVALLLIAMGLTLFNVTGYVILLGPIPVLVRYRVISLGHALGSMCFSSGTPAIATALYLHVGQSHALVMGYVLILVMMGLGALLFLNQKSISVTE